VQLYCYFVSQSSEFCHHNLLCCFSTSVCCLFHSWLSSKTFGYTLIHLSQTKKIHPLSQILQLDLSCQLSPSQTVLSRHEMLHMQRGHIKHTFTYDGTINVWLHSKNHMKGAVVHCNWRITSTSKDKTSTNKWQLNTQNLHQATEIRVEGVADNDIYSLELELKKRLAYVHEYCE